MIVPILALAGSMAAKRRVAPSLGTFPTTGRAVRRPAHRCRDHRRRAHVLPGPRAGPDRRAAPPERRKGLLMALLSVDLGRGTRRFQRFVTLGGAKPSAASRPSRAASSTRTSFGRRIPHAFRKLDPRLLIKNPVMFVVEITAVLVTLIAIADATGVQAAGAGGLGFQVQIGDLAVVHGPVRDLRRGRRRGARSRPGRDPAQDPLGDDRPPPHAPTGRSRTSARPSCARATSSSSRKARRSPATATSSRASASSTRPRSPASPRRSSRSRARTSGARSPAARRSSATGSSSGSRPIPGETFLDRMIALVEGAKRQRTPNEIALAILLAGLTIIFLMATVTLRPFGDVRGHDRRDRRARRPARLPHPDDDRRPAVRDRHRRHGPRRALQRPGHERPRRRGVR